VEYYNVVFTLPAPIADIAYQNKAALYGLLFDVAAEVLQIIAADRKHLGARIGATLVLHTWGSALTHHPHVHGIVPGGGIGLDGKTWVACRPGFFLPVRVLSRLFRRRFLEELQRLHDGGKLRFFGEHARLANAAAFKAWHAPLRKAEWVVYAKRPFAGPQAVLAYLSRYTHRVAISNSRLIAMDEHGVTFRWKDYRAKGHTRHKAMTLAPEEFMRRFLLHVLPGGFHRIRHYGLLANGSRKADLTMARELLHVAPAPAITAGTPEPATTAPDAAPPTFVCRHCGHAMLIVQASRCERRRLRHEPTPRSARDADEPDVGHRPPRLACGAGKHPQAAALMHAGIGLWATCRRTHRGLRSGAVPTAPAVCTRARDHIANRYSRELISHTARRRGFLPMRVVRHLPSGRHYSQLSTSSRAGVSHP
jgi:hypothetical protein